jgi:hypothetical protein
MRELEEKNQDLIGDSEEIDEVKDNSLYFGWNRRLHKYIIEG